MDSRWGNVFLGFNTQLPYNIYNFGCLITCIAMVCKYYGKEENPLSINDKLKKVNGFVSGGNYVPDAIENDRKSVPEWRERTAILEEKVKKDGESLNRIENKLDTINNFLLNK